MLTHLLAALALTATLAQPAEPVAPPAPAPAPSAQAEQSATADSPIVAPPPLLLNRPPAVRTAPVAPPAPPAPVPTPDTINGTKIMVFNFLDMRENELRTKVLDQIEGQLQTYLESEGATVQLIRSSQTQGGKWHSAGMGQAMVPVPQIIFGERAREKAFGNEFRLIIFPSRWESVGSWRHYDIRFVLEDARTYKTVFDQIYTGKHLVMIKESENSEKRGRKIIAALCEMVAEKKLAGPYTGK